MTVQGKNDRLDIPAILSRVSLFTELSADQLANIAANTREKRLAKGEMLFQKGDPAKGFYVVVFGQIKLAFPSSQGNEKVVDIVGPRQSFGEALMFMDKSYPLFAEALTDTLLLHVASGALFDALSKDASLVRHMLAGLSQRLHALVNDVESYCLYSSIQRVIGYLLQQCPQEGDGSGSVAVSLPVSKQVVASRLNLTPETLSRIFHDLSATGLIAVQGKQITIHDIEKLKAYGL
ncbi:MAG: Crp/Fnr family transcriptional regulator [Rhodocyclaceae bacterium]|nr:Crp/Fnr family transcriptional regulator [Rhodocyclaceae bacterium]